MRNLLNELIIAKKKKLFKLDEFEIYLSGLKEIDKNNIVNWDLSAGEEWASLYNKEYNISCIFHTKIGICFIICEVIPHTFKNALEKLHLVYVDSYDIPEWYIDLEGLKKEVKEVLWHTSSDCIDCYNLSIMDFYWATV